VSSLPRRDAEIDWENNPKNKGCQMFGKKIPVIFPIASEALALIAPANLMAW
jgi:hypothetical protein